MEGKKNRPRRPGAPPGSKPPPAEVADEHDAVNAHAIRENRNNRGDHKESDSSHPTSIYHSRKKKPYRQRSDEVADTAANLSYLPFAAGNRDIATFQQYGNLGERKQLYRKSRREIL